MQISLKFKSCGDPSCVAVLQGASEKLVGWARRGRELLSFVSRVVHIDIFLQNISLLMDWHFLAEVDFLATFLSVTSQIIMKPQNTQKPSLLLCKRGLHIFLESTWPFSLELVTLQILWVLFVPPSECSATCHFFTGLYTKAIACMCLLWGFMNHHAPLTTQLCKEVHAFNSSPQTERSSSNGWFTQNKKVRYCWKLSEGQQREKYWNNQVESVIFFSKWRSIHSHCCSLKTNKN